MLLKFVGFDLVHDTDTPSLLVHVNNHPFALFLHPLHRRMELISAVAALGSKGVACEAFRVNTHENFVLGLNVPLDKSDVLHAVHIVLINNDLEFSAVACGQLGRCRPSHEALRPQPEIDEIGDGHDLEVMFLREDFQIGHPGHGPVIFHDLADDPRGFESREPREIHRAFRLPGSHENTALPRADGKDMPGTHQVIRGGFVRHGRADRRRPVRCRYPRGHAPPRLYGNGESRAETGTIIPHHERQIQPVGHIAAQTQADQAPAVLRHEVDRLGRHVLRRHAEIPFVLTVFVIHQDNHPAFFHIINRFFNCTDRHFTPARS